MEGVRYEAPETLQAAVALLAGASGRRPRAGRRHRRHRADGNRPDRAGAPGRHQEDPGDCGRSRPRTAAFAIGAAVPGMEIVEHAAFCQGLAGRGRRRQADRLDPDQGPRHHGRQSVQRLAGRRQRAGPDRGRRDRPDRRPERHARSAGREHSDRPGQDLARQGRDRRLVLPAAAARAFGRCLSALHAAHRDGHRGGRRRRQPHARRRRHLHGGARRARRGGADRAAGEGGGRRARSARALDEAALERLAEAASAACRPIDDKRGTKEYRIKVAGVLAKRTALQALERARQS